MHVASSIVVVLSTLLSTTLCQPSPPKAHATIEARGTTQPDHPAFAAHVLAKRDAAANAYVRWEIARARAAHLKRRDAAPEPQLQFLGQALRGLGKGASKAPEKAGGKAAKEQGKNAGSGGGSDDAATGKMMAANLKKQGYKDANADCLTKLVGTLKMTGGNNGSYDSCWKKPDKDSIGSRASSARTAAFAAARKKGLM